MDAKGFTKATLYLVAIAAVTALMATIIAGAIRTDLDNTEQQFLKDCVEDGNSDFQCNNWWYLRSH